MCFRQAEFGVRRQSEAATALWLFLPGKKGVAIRFATALHMCGREMSWW